MQIPVHHNARISNITGRVVHDQIFCSNITQEATVAAIYAAMVEVIECIGELGHEEPMIMQFDALDEETEHVVSIVTNVRVFHPPKDKHGNVPEPVFNIRNSTIKSGLLNPHHLEAAEKEQAFYNDLDFYSRNFKRPELLPNGHFIGGDSQLEFKLQRCFAKEDD